jgi:hypothetical protein
MEDTLKAGALILTMTVAASAVLWSQGAPAPQTRPAAPVRDRNLLPDKGVIEGGTYKNAGIGLEFTPTSSLHLQEPDVKGAPDAPPSFFSVLAVADRGPLPALGFYAEKLDHYPEDKRDASSHLQRMIRAQEASGCKRVGGVTKTRLSEVSFVRADCEAGRAHEAVFVTTHSAWAFVFIFEASDAAAANKLIASTEVRVTD